MEKGTKRRTPVKKPGYSPKFTITNAITAGLTKIERARGFLDAAKLSEKWISEMQSRALLLEAHHTTHIEGTHLTLDQSARLLAGKRVASADPDDARELLNYRDAFELVAEYLGSGEPITEGLIREIHRRLVTGVRGDAATPGAYRKVQNYVANAATGTIVYTPPQPPDVPIMMGELVEWVRKEEETHPVLVAGISQFQFVHIHPFLDGNGRTGRLLSTLCLFRTGYDFKRLFTISEYYDRDRPAYYRAIQSVREHGMDLTVWLEYFVKGLATQMEEVQQRGERVIRVDILAIKHSLSSRQRAILSFAVGREQWAIKDLEAHLPDESRRSLQRDLQELSRRKLLATAGTTRERVYRIAAGRS